MFRRCACTENPAAVRRVRHTDAFRRICRGEGHLQNEPEAVAFDGSILHSVQSVAMPTTRRTTTMTTAGGLPMAMQRPHMWMRRCTHLPLSRWHLDIKNSPADCKRYAAFRAKRAIICPFTGSNTAVDRRLNMAFLIYKYPTQFYRLWIKSQTIPLHEQ